jgi:ABC-type branched-subunit amino acid transport system substrate-binding protein
VIGTRRALIVATGEYRDEKFRQLRAPAVDAERLAEVLGDPAIGEFEVDVALNEDESALRRRIARFFARSDRDDVLLLHLSGHGVKDAHGDLFLAARDTEIDLLATALAASWLDEQITRSPSRRILLLLDCCFSGKFPFNATARAGDSVDVPQRFKGHNRAVITATNATEYAYEGDRLSGDGHRSYFTDVLIEGLRTGEADRDQDQWISADELYDYIVDNIVPHQTPTKKSALEGLPFYVAHSNFVKPAVLDRDILELTKHVIPTVRLGAINDHLGPLMNDTANAGLALAARQRLEQMAKDDDSKMVASRAAHVLHERAQTVNAERAQQLDAERARGVQVQRARPAEDERTTLRGPANVSSGPTTAGPPPPDMSGPIRPTRRQLRYAAVVAVAVAAVIVVVIMITGGAGADSLRIYSSLPQTEQPASAAVNAEGHPFQRILDMQKAMQLAVDENNGKAGRFEVSYEPLDDSDASGDTPPALAQANAKRAATDPNAVVYIGEFNSAPTQETMPILSKADIAQISPAATRIGLTQHGPFADNDEPERYFKGSHNFVRIIPTTETLARALLARMARGGCATAALVDDDSSYGKDLAKHIRLYNKRNRRPIQIKFSDSINARGNYKYVLDGAREQKPNCFVYSGTRNANTLSIFSDFAKVLSPPAKLYGTNGVADDTFIKLLPRQIAKRVTVTLPWYSPKHSKKFIAAFRKANDGRTPDPYAFYGYEAMQLALDAIKRSKTGDREAVLAALRNARRPGSVLGSYSFTEAGDITPARAGISTISAARRRAAPELAPCPGC